MAYCHVQCLVLEACLGGLGNAEVTDIYTDKLGLGGLSLLWWRALTMQPGTSAAVTLTQRVG